MRLFIVVRRWFWVVKSVKGSIFMEFRWLRIVCHMLGMICYFMRRYNRLGRNRNDRLWDVKWFLVYLCSAVVDGRI